LDNARFLGVVQYTKAFDLSYNLIFLGFSFDLSFAFLFSFIY